MANEVPISEVLCDAMEYLCKLGTNLRVRSESLKEKRIRKDKLKNSHAVQKAADKVLLICELSKKSLENVELGVRKVLSLVNERYVSSSAPTSSSISKISSVTDKFQYFRHRSHKLKICKKVPVKHYISVKVLARRMATSLQDNYPVYYDCKLYRQRKKQENCRSKDKEISIKSNENEMVNTHNGDSDPRFIKNSCEHVKKSIINDGGDDTTFTNLTESQEPHCIGNASNSIDKDIESEKCCRNSLDDKKSQLGKKNKNLKSDEDDNGTKKSNKLNRKKFKNILFIDDSSENSNDSGLNKDNNKEIDTVLSGKDSFNSSDKTDLNHECEKTTRKLDASPDRISVESHDSVKVSEEKNQKVVSREEDQKVLSEEQEQKVVSEEQKQKVVSEDKTQKLVSEDKSQKVVSDEMDQKIFSEEKGQKVVSEGKGQKVVSEEKGQKVDTEDVRPMIKCVSINKLLKPDLTVTKDDNNIKKSEIKKVPKASDDEGLKRKNDLLKWLSTGSTKNEWAQKQKEVRAFKPIKLTVDIHRLPTFSVFFLQNHCLKKITQNNVVIYELDNSETLEENNDSRTNNINTLKNALLRDSESEKSDNGNSPSLTNSVDKISSEYSLKTKSTKERENIDVNKVNKELENDTDKLKQSLLYESDSDGNEKVQENSTNCASELRKPEQAKNGLCNELDSDKMENLNNQSEDSVTVSERCIPPEVNSINKKLSDKELSPEKELSPPKESEKAEARSSVDELKTPPNEKKKRKSIESETPKSKRKHIMESMHAKKMLLTYSSSSDTEDEQLRNALKEIKDSLLKGISSDDEQVAKTDPKKYSSDSDSDEDVLNKVKVKKRKLKDSTEQERHQENEKSSKKIGRSREQPGGSSQNSDSQDSNDKNIDGLTNLKNLMKIRRRRDSTSTDANTDSNSIKTNKMPKVPLISEEVMLDAESGSEVASGGESDGPEEDLPPVSLSGLNGSGGDHLAKDDLLGESDSSTSHNEKDEGDKNDSEDDNPKSRRRKANAISSDSEVGSSRKKDKDVRLSDFEDSEDESSDQVKRNKRKKKGDESDASLGSSSNDERKKRRRIKQLNDSDASGSDTENEGRNKHGRKNIRKVMGKNQLEEATKKAAREEKERIARIAERQKVYNNLEFDESGKPDEVVLEKVILDFDPETKEPLIEVDRGLVKKLKPHQANGIKFMWNACFESVKRIKKDRGSGCILAHCMGLGKTLQVVSLTHTLLTHSDLTKVNRVLVVCPLSTVLNWVNEFNMWLKHSITEYEVDVYELSRYKQNSERAFQLQQWFEGGGVCVLGYEMFRNLSADNPKKFKKKMLRHFQEALVDPGPDLVVCDEGHLLKNEKTSLSQSMNRVRTHRRIVLTGTPLQNNLKEYYCMVQFVKPNLLGKYNEYLNRFVNPITNGQYTDSTEHDIRIMKRRSHVLHKMLDGAVQRRDYGVLAPFLPPKHEYVLFITLTEVQTKLYQFYLDNYSRRPLPGKSSGFLFPDFQSLQRIWTHPLVLKYNSERYEIMQQKKREREEEEDSEGSLADFIDDESTAEESSTEESSEDLSDASDDSRKKKKKKSLKKGKGKDSKAAARRGTRANPVEMEEDEVHEVVELKAENPTEWWIKLVTEDELEDMRFSHKLILLFDILRQCETIGDKLLVFSQSLYSLDLIEHFLGKVDEATQDGRIDEKLGGHVGSWSPGVDYFRLDGSTSCENRSIWCKNFNREDNPRARLFLISTRAGGLGINLVAANRVVIFDVSWNPSHDVQSIFRVYRFGQKKPCYIYRFLAMGTMEEKIYERQVTKQAISKRVIDEQQIDRHYAENDLAELYKFEASPPTPRPLPPLPKDRLFAEMLKEHEAQIYKYHEHDSLLENKEEETLSEEERKAAWEDFENEKNRPPPAPFPSAWPMHNGMVPGLLAQQQQQLAYAALAAMLRKDMPNINDNQIRDMLPLIYNANPTMFGGYDYGLMQKMTEIYKYAPGAMMNPAMMNQVMNPAAAVSGGGGGMGGTSGLQYSPPWQRQHQQQQQMRLQQLMQHQNMGAKYYAGGLGSRDPVAMALQQQRAREIMTSEQQARGRPRGRPPLPRADAAPAHAADVVNLDSD